MDDLALIQAARHGDVDAFNDLIVMYQSRAYNVAYRILGETMAAADATQEAFIAAYQKLDQFRGGSFRAWLMRIVTNACYDERRRRMRHPEQSLEAIAASGEAQPKLVATTDNPEGIAQQQALNQIIQDCLQALSDDQRIVAILADIQDYDYAEIAEIVRLPLGTIKSRLSRARQALRACLQTAGELLPLDYRLQSKPNKP
jgi:RNA polymerase sigma-70 factor (ECF subfamily)